MLSIEFESVNLPILRTRVRDFMEKGRIDNFDKTLRAATLPSADRYRRHFGFKKKNIKSRLAERPLSSGTGADGKRGESGKSHLA